MDAGLLSLKWNNHSSTFFHVLESVRKKGLYSDVTLACEGKYFEVHKLILSTCSDYFQEMFEKTQCKHPIIVLKDISNKDLESLLNYMYIGEVNVLQNELSSLIKAAECLRVKGLAVPDEPPPTKKSNKRQSDREESSASKRNRKSGSTHSSERNITSPSTRDDLNDQYSQREPSLPTRTNENERDSSNLKDFEPVMVKVEKSEEITEDFTNSDMNSVVKFEQFDDGSGDRNPLDVPASSAMNNEDGSGTFSSQQNLEDTGQNYPSTSGYDESSNWSGDIETIDDDDDDVGGEGMGVDMGLYDPNAFLDPSQASKGPMTSYPIVDGPLMRVPSCDIRVNRQTNVWICCFPLCPYSSRDKSEVRKHTLIHTDQKPFSCRLCSYRTRQSSNLRTHMRRKHAESLQQLL